MNLMNNELFKAVRYALYTGAVAAAGLSAVPALAQDDSGQKLETITVTGSNIRRVDIETANPVLTIDRAQIQASGKINLGDLVQELPSMAGAAMNTQTNNGGNGSAGVSLRGLGSSRTLLLINGHRIPAQLQDLNIVPISVVERVEILNDGASAIYGSDAIGGVVNIITRKDYQGAEVGVDYGISDRDDGNRKSTHIVLGQSSDKGSIVFGLQYDKQEAVPAAHRDFSKNAQYRYNTSINTNAGSSRTPGGRFDLPSGSPIATALGCTSVTLTGRAAPTNPNPPTPADFRCYNSTNDSFNFQAVGNYNLVPSERTGMFVLGNYKLTDNVEAYVEALHHKNVTHTQLAPYPFDLNGNNLVIPADQYYNPFGVAIGEGGDGNIRLRLTSLGNRGSKLSTTTDDDTIGFRGTFGDSSWTWDAHFSYGKLANTSQALNYINISQIAAGFGCTTAPGVGACTPIDIFNQADPSTLALLNAAKINPFTTTLFQNKTEEVSTTGNLFSLPAGDVQASIGLSHNSQYVNSQVDPLLQSTFNLVDGVPTITCPGPGSICSSPTQGGYTTKEAYAELLIPVLKDLPFVHSLTIDLGDRFSKYSNFGSTSNWKVAIEYRPIEDLLLRGTVAKVFRAPSPSDLYSGPSQDAPTAADPCAGVAGVSGNRACQGINVPPQTGGQITGFVMGSQFAANNGLSSLKLEPEFGKSFDYGFVYDPQWINGLSISGDYYRILLNNLIVSGPGIAQTILTQCFNTQGPICSDIVRFANGNLKFVTEAPFNSGDLVTQGFDVGVHYRLPETPFGNFRVGVDGTYIQAYNVTQGGFTQHLAGHYDKTYGNFARIRGLGTLDWNIGGLTATWQARYVGPVNVGYVNAGLGPSGLNTGSYTPNPYGPVIKAGGLTYHNFSLGYTIAPINTYVGFGVDNVFDKQAPVLYQNNVLNANTDVATYDTIGRYYHASVTVKF